MRNYQLPGVIKAMNSRAWRFMLFGGVGAGKTTLLNALEGKDTALATKSQMIDYSGWGIDSPGEYSEMGHYRQVLLTAAFDAKLILVLQDASRDETVFPPHYFLMFPQRVLGVVSKMDAEGADPARARKLLEEMGVTGKIFFVSSLTGLGIKSLKDYLLSQTI
jgi:ethanolamine utilization protein EutP